LNLLSRDHSALTRKASEASNQSIESLHGFCYQGIKQSIVASARNHTNSVDYHRIDLLIDLITFNPIAFIRYHPGALNIAYLSENAVLPAILELISLYESSKCVHFRIDNIFDEIDANIATK
jgi:hypothetical protein